MVVHLGDKWSEFVRGEESLVRDELSQARGLSVMTQETEDDRWRQFTIYCPGAYCKLKPSWMNKLPLTIFVVWDLPTSMMLTKVWKVAWDLNKFIGYQTLLLSTFILVHSDLFFICWCNHVIINCIHERYFWEMTNRETSTLNKIKVITETSRGHYTCFHSFPSELFKHYTIGYHYLFINIRLHLQDLWVLLIWPNKFWKKNVIVIHK